MSDCQRFKLSYEHHDQFGHWLKPRLLIFRGEIEIAPDGTVTGSTSPLYEPLQVVRIDGKIDLATGEVDLATHGPENLDLGSWDPEQAYLWSVNSDGKVTWYHLPDKIRGAITQTAEGVWMGELDRNDGKLELQLTAI